VIVTRTSSPEGDAGNEGLRHRVPFPPMSSGDTTAAAREVQCAALRALGPAGRVELALEMSEQARAIAIDGIVARHAGVGPEQARARLLRRLLGAELFDAAYRGRRPG
jgi:hypothetical protein